MQEERKKIIRYALDYDIIDVHTYNGYKGDLVVRITVKEKDAMLAIRKYALASGIKEVIIKENKDVIQYEIYCITEDEGAYHIKETKALDEIHTKHITDAWNKQE
ncbi:MAG: hypothetical protein M1300_10000 [Epsilonproteobacteria bacterium]|nr:hypothetical protein [Campylobacterota bacterium]